jgi:bacterioferritin-associated ferredoxin
MFVCLCNALRERDCKTAAAHPDTRSPACIYRRLGCQVRCGACVKTMREIIEYVRVENLNGSKEGDKVLTDAND